MRWWDEMRLDDVRWDDMRCDEIRWNEMRLDEMRRDEMRWDEIEIEIGLGLGLGTGSGSGLGSAPRPGPRPGPRPRPRPRPRPMAASGGLLLVTFFFISSPSWSGGLAWHVLSARTDLQKEYGCRNLLERVRIAWSYHKTFRWISEGRKCNLSRPVFCLGNYYFTFTTTTNLPRTSWHNIIKSWIGSFETILGTFWWIWLSEV